MIASRISGQGVPTGWKFFHLSFSDLGPKAVFQPSIPSDATEDMHEDFTTLRVCLAPTLEGCLLALPIGGDLFIYGTRSSGFFQPDKSPFDWEGWEEYAEENGLDPEDEDALARTLEGTIPDPETGEVWSLKPVTLHRLGKLSAPSGELDSVSWGAGYANP